VKWLAVLMMLPSVAMAQAAPADALTPLDLGVAMQRALEHNPGLRAAAESVPQAVAQRDQAFALIQPKIDLGLQYRINDREIAFDIGDGFSGITDAFGTIYGNLGLVYEQLFELGALDAADCDRMAEINGFDDCASMTDVLINGGEFDTGSTDTPAEPTVIQAKSQLFVALNVTWPLSPSVITLASAGARQIDAAEAQLRATREQIVFGVVQAYAGAYQAQEGIAVLLQQVELAAAHRRDTEALFRAGMVTRDLLLRAQVEEQKILLQLSQLQQQHRTLRRAVGVLMGTGMDGVGPLQPLPEVVVDATADARDWAGEALEKRPELRQAEAMEKAAKNMQIDAGLQFLPQLAVTGSWSWTDQSAGFDGKQDSWWIGLGASIPIWDGALKIHKARVAASQRRQAQANIDSQRMMIEQEARDAFDQWNSARDALPVAQLEHDLAAEAYRLAEVRYRAGTARQIEILDARAVLQGSELSLLQARVAERVAGAALLKAAGQVRLWAGSLGG
jgi:outer membrane protein TolC